MAKKLQSMVIHDVDGRPHKVSYNGVNYVDSHGTAWHFDGAWTTEEKVAPISEQVDFKAPVPVLEGRAVRGFIALLHEFTEKVPNAFILDVEGRIRMTEAKVQHCFGIEQECGVGDPISVLCAETVGEFYGVGYHAAAQAMKIPNPDGFFPLKLSKKAADLINAACDLGEQDYSVASSRWSRIIRNRHLVGSAHHWQQILDRSDIATMRSVIMSVCNIRCELVVVEQK